ncbi:Hypothetical predicted protein [Cloeon dipterum]|uniref:28S ribosomal protein S30, mitochondrial n=1 Tax=Cloeon dipterum TaxID=197152 RepID=A0A8S1BYX9_9INSE|nr:Hypothetical predicted protein [Cloeon dipterum]
MSTNMPHEEYSDEPQYPPIKDLSWWGKKVSEAEAQHEEVKKLGTIEEKILKINMPRYYGWKCHLFREAIFNTNDVEESAKQLAEEVKADFIEALAFEWSRPADLEENASRCEVEKVKTQRILESLNTIMMSRLRRHVPHLSSTVTDSEPRLEAAWRVGGIELERKVRVFFESRENLKKWLDWPRDRSIQYLGNPVLHVRANHPLQPIIGDQESMNEQLEVPQNSLDPRIYGNRDVRRYMTNIPGFWPGDDHRFGILSFLGRDYQLSEIFDTRPDEDRVEMLHCQAIMASFAWLFSQACYLGFSTYQDVTYPLVSQTVISNGQHWSFYAYQLNTTLLHFQNTANNPKRNVCWSSQPVKLFESIDNGHVKGLNMDVLKTLVKFYLNEPKERIGVNLTPYLDPETPMVSKIEEEDKRVFLENLFKKVSLNGKKHEPDPEYWNWEWIYKIKNKSRPQEARRRPFELWQDPWRLSFYELSRKYVPKARRKNPKSNKEKWEKTYYP